LPTQIATALWWIGIAGLFYLDRDRRARTSPALWIAVAWLLLGASRNVSAWLGAGAAVSSPDQYLEGSPLDRNILSLLLVLAMGVLVARGRTTVELLRRNPALVLFVIYCLLSALWSDFPFVSFKRWTKLLGNVTMALLVLTDPDPRAALKRLLTRTAFILIPMSVLLIKYHPELGRYYDRWLGTPFYSGVATDKNTLGVLCLVLGLAVFWRLVHTFRSDEIAKTRQRVALSVVLLMNLWLFHMADSATSLGCFMLGAAIITTLAIPKTSRPILVYSMVGGLALVGLTAYLFRDAYAFLVESMGRNTTLTGRTDLWDELLQIDTHPWLGTGFESFFLGDRLDILWSKYWWHPNEAHNGYLEFYLTIGWVGLGLLSFVIIAGFRNVLDTYRRDPKSGSLKLAYFILPIIYNLTEAGFKVMNPIWILFILAVTAVPDSQTRHQAEDVSKERQTRHPGLADRLSGTNGRRPGALRPDQLKVARGAVSQARPSVARPERRR
jgi:O-antigen ligase